MSLSCGHHSAMAQTQIPTHAGAESPRADAHTVHHISAEHATVVLVLVSITLSCKMSSFSMLIRKSSTLRNTQTAIEKPIFRSQVRTCKLTATQKYPAASRMALHMYLFKPNIWDRPKSNNMELINSIIRKRNNSIWVTP